MSGLGAAESTETSDVANLYQQAATAAARGDSQKAVQLAGQVIEADPAFSLAYYLRGREQFRLGQVRESAADFDRFIELQPDRKASLWERGISLYYVDRFQEGARQFELYQTTYANDVENSVWRYLCVARTEGVAKARKNMLPIRNDSRIPMMEIYRMFRGETAPEVVLAAAEADPSSSQPALAGRRFYAHLYVGLYYDANGETDLARKHIRLAADPKNERAQASGYMWDVARIHAQHLARQDSSRKPPEPARQ